MAAFLIFFGVLAVAIALIAVGIVFSSRSGGSGVVTGSYTVQYSSVIGITKTAQTGNSSSGTVTFTIDSTGTSQNFGVIPSTAYPLGASHTVNVTSGSGNINSLTHYISAGNLLITFNSTSTGSVVFAFTVS